MGVVLAVLLAAGPKSIAVELVTHAHGDGAVADLCQSALSELMPLRDAQSADFLGKLRVQRTKALTVIDLDVADRSGARVVRASEIVTKSQSMIDAARTIAQRVAAVCNPAAPGDAAPSPDGARAPVAPAAPSPESPASAPATPAPAPEEAPPPRHKPVEHEPSAPSHARADPADDGDWAGHGRFLPEAPHHLDFLLGLELGYGPASMDPTHISQGAGTGFDLSRYAARFTSTIDGHAHPAFDVHGGVGFLDYGAFELAFQSSLWKGGSAILAGAHLAGYPLPLDWPRRRFSPGIELGFGRAFFGGSGYDMSGSYWTFALTGEYLLSQRLGVIAFWRLFRPTLGTFYTDYQRGLSEPVQDFTATWNTFGIGVSLHERLSWGAANGST